MIPNNYVYIILAYPLDESSFILTDQSYMCLMDEMLS